MLPSLSPCSQQVPGSLPPGRMIWTWDPPQEPERPRGCAEPIQGPGACHDLPTQEEPGCSEEDPWHFLKRARRQHAGAQPHAHSPASTGQDPVLSCASHFLFPKLAAQDTQRGHDGEATCPGWARGSDG